MQIKQHLMSEYSLQQAVRFYSDTMQNTKVKAAQHKRAILTRLLDGSVLSAKEAKDVRAVNLHTLKSRLKQHCGTISERSLHVYAGRAKTAITEFIQSKSEQKQEAIV